MKKSSKWTSIIESIILVFIMTIWIVWMYKVFNSSNDVLNATTNRVEAIQIAREWLEAITTMRNTNWMLFSADYDNCWNSMNNSWSCVLNSWSWTDILSWSYIIYKNSSDKWILEKKSTDVYTGWTYIDDFKVYLDNSSNTWFYNQNSWDDFWPNFTRELIIDYIEDTNNDLDIDSNDEKMQVTSLVQWLSKWIHHKVELTTVLSNWKKIMDRD